MQFALDADGVIFDFDGAWHTVAQDVLDRPLPLVRLFDYALSARYALTNKEYNKVWAAFNALGIWERMPLQPGAVETIQMLLDMGHGVHVITSIPDHAIPYRERQLEKLFGQAVVLHPAQCGDDEKPEKSVFLRAIRPMFYADDLWAYCGEACQCFVPYVARIDDGTHGGDGKPVDGVHVHDCLKDAVQGFFQCLPDLQFERRYVTR